jgi:hypothetical protein
LRRRKKVALTAIVVLALTFFFFVPLIGASAPAGGPQPSCYFAGTCKQLELHFTISLSCYLSGDSPEGFFLGDSYSLQVTENGSNLFFGCGGPLVD